ncbi:DinB family protein [Flavobacterium agricola]|uniref:DinB family protein n=1 Tax=Flavobacterium agricola TaxID=2870839 RepID=A0ABY6M3Z6_9FLAO|nr:DinB family protein [Flavobacterium agricola]UYW02559.1 DinB family protein [Flavobacterium agricola]
MIYPDFDAYYVGLIPSDYTLVESLEIQLYEGIKFVQNIPMDKFDYAYAEGKWTIKEILQHLIDCERIFAYRALAIARNDKNTMLLFDENLYAQTVAEQAKKRHLKAILEELSHVRLSTIALYKSLTTADLNKVGLIGNYEISVDAIFAVILGHQIHHLNFFEKQYL